MTYPAPHRPFAPAIISADFKTYPADFIVKELMDVDFSGQGEHLWVHVCKVGMNTAFVAKLLANWANICIRDVGYSGLKDRHAQTYQWFSLRLPKRGLPTTAFDEFIKEYLKEGECLTLITHHWHEKKLHRGTHKANAFTITLRQVTGEISAINAQLAHVGQMGVPNYVGKQRFGHDGDNIHQAKVFFEKICSSGKPYKPFKKDTDKHSLYVSSARSMIFNALVSKRVQLGCWDKAISGDVFNLDGTGSIFCADIDDEIIRRVAEQDIHPTAPLFGVGELKNSDESLRIYQSVLTQDEFELFKNGLLKVGVKLTQRPLRLRIYHLDWQWSDNNLTLHFELPTGSFATSVLFAVCEHLIQNR